VIDPEAVAVGRLSSRPAAMGSPKPLLWNLLLETVERVKSPALAMQTPLLKFWRKSLPSKSTSSTRPLFSMLMPLPSRQGL
jgi:hypothetical protein